MPAQRPIRAASDARRTVDFEAAFEHAPTSFAIFQVHARDIVLVAVNTAALNELGLAPDADVVGRVLEDVFMTEFSLVLSSAIRQAADLERPARAMLETFGGAPGTRREVVATVIDTRAPGRLVLVAIAARTTRGPRASALTLDQLEALGKGQIFVFDLRRECMRYLSPELAHMIGHSMESPLDLETVRALIHADDFAAVDDYFSHLGPMGAATASSVTMRIRRPEGGWRWLETRGRALTFDAAGNPRTVVGVAVDITERRTMSRALDRATRAVLRAGEQERRRVARNLHDSTAQHLVAIDLGLSRLNRRVPANPETAAIMRDMREALAAAHREIRTYSYLLHPPQLQRLGLEGTLRRLVEGFGRRAEFAIELEVSGVVRRLNTETELALFRVAQEAIMNVHRHSQADRTVVRLLRSATSIVLEVEDNGVGLRDEDEIAEVKDDGAGISGMQARMTQIGGTLELIRKPRGLCVRAQAPA
jgi:PAS domain S-box-containing protein